MMKHDFLEIFKDQLASEKPYTKGNVNATLHLLAHHMKPREIMQRSKYLKTKIGVKRLLYYKVDIQNGKEKETIEKVWEDEFDQLQELLDQYTHTGMNGILPVFRKDT